MAVVRYIVYLYIEGGERDGDTTAAGPFDQIRADSVASQLEQYGQVEVIECHTTVEELIDVELP